MKKIRLSVILFLLFISIGFYLQAQNSGEELYKSTCTACHTIGKGRLVGPDLSGIHQRAETDWLIKFIRSSQTMIKEGDPEAVRLFNEYNKVPMPDNNWSDEQILSVLEYIKAQDSGGAATTATAGEAADSTSQAAETTAAPAEITFSDEMVMRGKALFYGHEKFANGASSCIACHKIQDESLIGGGKLSLDLTKSYTRLGLPGINAILSNPPFPVMNIALKENKLTDDEIQAISALLQFADTHYGDRPQDTIWSGIFGIFGLIVSLFLLVHIYLMYDNRKIPS